MNAIVKTLALSFTLSFALGPAALASAPDATAEAFAKALAEAALRDGRAEVRDAVQAIRSAGFAPEILEAARRTLEAAPPDFEERVREAVHAWAPVGRPLPGTRHERVVKVILLGAPSRGLGEVTVELKVYVDWDRMRTRRKVYVSFAADDLTYLRHSLY